MTSPAGLSGPFGALRRWGGRLAAVVKRECQGVEQSTGRQPRLAQLGHHAGHPALTGGAGGDHAVVLEQFLEPRDVVELAAGKHQTGHLVRIQLEAGRHPAPEVAAGRSKPKRGTLSGHLGHLPKNGGPALPALRGTSPAVPARAEGRGGAARGAADAGAAGSQRGEERLSSPASLGWQRVSAWTVLPVTFTPGLRRFIAALSTCAGARSSPASCVVGCHSVKEGDAGRVELPEPCALVWRR